MKIDNTKYVTIKDIIEETKISRKTILKYLNTGVIKGNKAFGKWIVTRENFERYLAGKEQI